MAPKFLTGIFSGLSGLLPKKAAKTAPADPGNTVLPYDFIVDLFRFRKEERYVTEPEKQWTVRQAMGLDVHSRMASTTNFGSIRTFYADPEQHLKIEHKWPAHTIMPPPPPDIVPSSPAIYGSEDQAEFNRSLIVAIRDRVTDPEQPMKNIAFGLYGWSTKEYGLRFKKILVPAIDSAHRMTGMREVNLKDRDDVARALTYAKICADQLFSGEQLTVRQNMQNVMRMDAAQLVRVPWMMNKTPDPAPNPQ